MRVATTEGSKHDSLSCGRQFRVHKVLSTPDAPERAILQGVAELGIDLRGLGVSRTLVLVNGRRVPQFPFGQDGSSSFVDINLIPLGLVERVEILKDGASAIYGSDAIAGVVNIILRRDYEGVDVSASYGQSDESDGDERRFTFAGGRTGSRGNVTFGLEYLDRDNVWSKNRDLSSSANGPFDDRSRAGNPGTSGHRKR